MNLFSSVLSGGNHKNFTNLLVTAHAIDEPFTWMMVFEYSPCGSLFEHLHGECLGST
jgi:hypothetical protein